MAFVSQPAYSAGSGLALNNNVFSLAEGVARVQRGSYEGTGASQDVAVGFRPQVVFVAANDVTRDGIIWDAVDNQERGFRPSGPTHITSGTIDLTANGFTVPAASVFNNAGQTYYWIALGGAA